MQSDPRLGIGLYQAARQARENDYRLALLDTPNGATFLLAPLREGGEVRTAVGMGGADDGPDQLLTG